jgi:hypothetical protein
MPHAVYIGAFILCPWSGCGYRVELIDFQLEKMGDQAFYSLVMTNWGNQPDFGLVGRCPSCGQFVRFGLTDKKMVADPGETGLPLLADDWHHHAYIEG